MQDEIKVGDVVRESGCFTQMKVQAVADGVATCAVDGKTEAFAVESLRLVTPEEVAKAAALAPKVAPGPLGPNVGPFTRAPDEAHARVPGHDSYREMAGPAQPVPDADVVVKGRKPRGRA